MPPFLPNPVEHLLQRLSRGEGRCIVGMAGTPGSGKSTFAAHLSEAVNRRSAPGTMIALGMDGFHWSQAALREFSDPAAAFARRGAPWTFDVEGLAARLSQLRTACKEVAWPDFQHEIGDPIEAAFHVPPATRLILVEGLYLLKQTDGWEKVGAALDERWYLDTPPDVAGERLTKRHMKAWNLTREAAQKRIATNDGLNAKIVANTRDFADWLVQDI